MCFKGYAYLLGLVAMFAGFATMVFSSSRLIDIFGGAVLLGGEHNPNWWIATKPAVLDH